MPWSQKYHLRAGSLQGDACDLKQVRRTNRHASCHIKRVYQQTLLLEFEEKAALQEHTKTEAGKLKMEFGPVRGVRRPGESSWAVSVCNDYLLMPRRSLVKLHKRLLRDQQQGLTCAVPSLDTLKSWSRRYQWQARALLLDAETNTVLWMDLEQRRSMRELACRELERRGEPVEVG